VADVTPRLLILETSGRPGRVAVAEGEHLLAEHQLDDTRRHARDLAPTVAALLEAAGWRPRQVEAVIVSRGPGSYTGLRVGIMSVKTFAYATGCALLAIDTFAAIALQAPAETQRLEVIADAQQQKVYVQSFGRSEAGELLAVTPLTILPLAEWQAGLATDVWVSGPGVDVYDQILPTAIQRVTPELRQPGADSLLRLGLRRWRAGERDDLWMLEPLYLRPSSAEEKWAQRS